MSDAYNYGFRRESGYCAIEWSAPNNTQSVNGSTGYFTLSGLATTAALTAADAKVFFIFFCLNCVCCEVRCVMTAPSVNTLTLEIISYFLSYYQLIVINYRSVCKSPLRLICRRCYTK